MNQGLGTAGTAGQHEVAIPPRTLTCPAVLREAIDAALMRDRLRRRIERGDYTAITAWCSVTGADPIEVFTAMKARFDGERT